MILQASFISAEHIYNLCNLAGESGTPIFATLTPRGILYKFEDQSVSRIELNPDGSVVGMVSTSRRRAYIAAFKAEYERKKLG